MMDIRDVMQVQRPVFHQLVERFDHAVGKIDILQGDDMFDRDVRLIQEIIHSFVPVYSIHVKNWTSVRNSIVLQIARAGILYRIFYHGRHGSHGKNNSVYSVCSVVNIFSK